MERRTFSLNKSYVNFAKVGYLQNVVVDALDMVQPEGGYLGWSNFMRKRRGPMTITPDIDRPSLTVYDDALISRLS